MNWQIEWGTDPVVFGYDFVGFLIEGIEAGIAELEQLDLNGNYCHACGKFRITEAVQVDTGRELLPHEICAECYDEVMDRGHSHVCQQCDKMLAEDCHCNHPHNMNWCSSNCRAAYDL